MKYHLRKMGSDHLQGPLTVEEIDAVLPEDMGLANWEALPDLGQDPGILMKAPG